MQSNNFIGFLVLFFLKWSLIWLWRQSSLVGRYTESPVSFFICITLWVQGALKLWSVSCSYQDASNQLCCLEFSFSHLEDMSLCAGNQWLSYLLPSAPWPLFSTKHMPFVNKQHRQSTKHSDCFLNHNIPHNGRGLKGCRRPEGEWDIWRSWGRGERFKLTVLKFCRGRSRYLHMKVAESQNIYILKAIFTYFASGLLDI